jgi:hypothetical protein
MVPLVPDNFFSAIPHATGIEKDGVAALTQAIVVRDARVVETASVATRREQGSPVAALLTARGILAEPRPLGSGECQ